MPEIAIMELAVMAMPRAHLTKAWAQQARVSTVGYDGVERS